MNKLIALMVSVVMTGAAFSGVTTHFALDTRSGMRLAPAGSTLAVDYSPDYSTVQNVTTVRVLTNGTLWVESAAGGTKDFTFGDTGLYQFTHQVLTNGVVAEEMSAWYAVRSAADYLGVQGIAFTTGGDAAWVIDFETSHDGEASMRSGTVGTSQTSWIETKATVKEEIVKEALDVEKGAVVELLGGSQGTASPTITTAPTRVGLVYTFSEGRTLGGMQRSASKPGDGKPWTPEIKVKGGSAAFYSIGVEK